MCPWVGTSTQGGTKASAVASCFPPYLRQDFVCWLCPPASEDSSGSASGFQVKGLGLGLQTYTTTSSFTCILGIQTQVCTLVQEALYHCASPWPKGMFYPIPWLFSESNWGQGREESMSGVCVSHRSSGAQTDMNRKVGLDSRKGNRALILQRVKS